MTKIVKPKSAPKSVEMRCRCGGTVYATTEDYSVTHSVPACGTFMELDPIAFLRYLRGVRE